MSKGSFSISSPNKTEIEDYSLTSLESNGEAVLWIGRPSRVAFFYCTLPRIGIYISITLIYLTLVTFFQAANSILVDNPLKDKGFTISVVIVLDFVVICFFVATSAAASNLVYFVTNKTIGIKIDSNKMHYMYHMRKAVERANEHGIIAYDLGLVSEIVVKKTFFGRGNFDFKNFAFQEKRFFDSDRTDKTNNVLAEKPVPQPRAIPHIGSTGKKSGVVPKVVQKFTVFPGTDIRGGAYSTGVSIMAGFYGIDDVRMVRSLIETQLAYRGK
jgi:hypothetical protein